MLYCYELYCIVLCNVYFIFQSAVPKVQDDLPVTSANGIVPEVTQDDTCHESSDDETPHPIPAPCTIRTGRTVRPPARYLNHAQLADTSKQLEGTIQFTKLSNFAITSTLFSKQSLGLQLHGAYNYVVEPHHKKLINTDIQITLLEGYYDRIAPRSDLAAKHFIYVGAGVTDANYRGNTNILLFNFSDNDFKIKQGDRIT